MPRERNLLLKSLSAADFSLIEPHLRPLEFKQHKVLFEAGQSVSTVYFLYNAIVSLVVTLSTGESIEAAMVGRDGVIGASAALDGRVSLSRAIVLIAGDGAACDAEALKGGGNTKPHIALSVDPPRTGRLRAGTTDGGLQCHA